MAGNALRSTSTVIGSAAISVASYGDDDFARWADRGFVAFLEQGGRRAFLDDRRTLHLGSRRQRVALIDGASCRLLRVAEIDIAISRLRRRNADLARLEFHLGAL